jgi:peptidoglycan/LPS O-acetylase OafA/YrhL
VSAIPVEAAWYRRDITGMRSIAIIPVVVFHAGAQIIPGGFIGVDVFYVISGFLITTLLVNEAEATGSVRLGNFWAKRLRRLVPALVVTVAITLPIAAAVSPVLSWDTLSTQAAASVFYVANVLFWRKATDYFDTDGGQSPYLHMWSLGVEEQFYIVWPVIVFFAIWLARKRLSIRWILALCFGTVFATSLTLSVALTPSDPNAAFYLLPTRAWEFAGSGLVALLPLAKLVKSQLVASILAIIGTVVIVVGLLLIDESDLYPGYLALIPFLGTILLLVSGAGANSVLTPLWESRLAVWVGNVSYSWYLWHWPLIVIGAALFPSNDFAVAAAAALSLGAAALSYRFVERPVRYSPVLAKSMVRTYASAVGATAAVALLAAGLSLFGGFLLDKEPLRTYAQAAETVPRRDCADGTAVDFGSDKACVLGDVNAATTIAMIGDSHAGHWRAAMDQAARDAGYRLIFRWKSSCPSTDIVVGDFRGIQDPACAQYRAETARILAAAHADAVIISNAYAYGDKILSQSGERIAIEQQREEWKRGLAEQIDTLRKMGSQVGVVRDNPRMLFNPTACLARLGYNADDCNSTWDEAHSLIRDFGTVADRVYAEKSLRQILSVDDAICWDDVCRALSVDGTPIYQDQTHLSRMWTLSHVPRLRKFLSDLLADPRSEVRQR